MGMFDTIKVHKSLLPNPPANIILGDFVELQTKDLDCMLAVYELREDGLFMVGPGWTDDQFDTTAISHRGELRVYTGWKNEDEEERGWYEVSFLMKNGKILDCELVERKP